MCVFSFRAYNGCVRPHLGSLFHMDQSRNDHGNTIRNSTWISIIAWLSFNVLGCGFGWCNFSHFSGQWYHRIIKIEHYYMKLSGFESFLYWFAFFISGFFLLTHVTNLTQTLESKVPAIAKIVSCCITILVSKLGSPRSIFSTWQLGVLCWPLMWSTDSSFGIWSR